MFNRLRQLRQEPVKAFDVSERLGSVITPSTSKALILPTTQQPKLPAEIVSNRPAPKSAFHLIDPGNDASKSLAYSQYVQDFIYATGQYSQPYTDPQLEMAFWSSVYLFAALRRVSNLISRAKVVAEVKNGDTWQRLPETSRLNQILQRDMPTALKIGYLNYALYGATLTYKVKTERAMIRQAEGRPIYSYLEGAVAGLMVLDNPGWSLNETTTTGYNSLKGVFLNYDYKDILGEKNYLDRREFVYITDWNPRDKNHGRSIASVAIHEAVTNGAIARWASEYFTRGTLPMLLVSMTDNPAIMTQTDLAKQKRFFEEQYQGQSASLRSVFVDQKVDVNEIGITADRVAAPELNKNALEGISAAVGIERDLIIAPEGGTQGRHRTMVQQAWNDTIIPVAQGFCAQYRQDLGLPEHVRLEVDVSHIAELEADRGDRSTAELAVLEKSVQTINETRLRLNQQPIPEMKNFMLVNGELKSIKKILLEDSMPSDKIFSQITGAWDADLILKSDALKMLGRSLRPGEKDGYKSELAPSEGNLGAPPDEEPPPAGEPEPNEPGDPPASPDLGSEKPDTEEKPEPETKSVEEDELDDLLEEFEDEDEDDDENPEVFIPDAVTIQEPQDMSIFVSIPLTNNAAISEMKRKLARAFGTTPGISWKEDNSFHVTLVFSTNCDDETLNNVVKLIPKLEAPQLTIGPLICFEQERRTVVALNVNLDHQLQSLQQSIVNAFQAYNIEMNQYSEIGSWNPHVTMCEVKPGTEIPDFNYQLKLIPSLITFSRTDENDRAFIKLSSSVDRIGASVDEHYLDLIDKELAEKREDICNKLLLWRDTGVSGGLPDRVIECVNEYADRIDAFSAAIQACECGMFDPDSDTDYNPLEKFMKGVQTTPYEELTAWKRVAKANLKKAKVKFQVSKLPVDIEQYVRSSLVQSESGSPSAVDQIFVKAFTMLDQENDFAKTGSDHLEAVYNRLKISEDPDLKSLVEGME